VSRHAELVARVDRPALPPLRAAGLRGADV
jgi:hypothetical protein